MCIVYSVGAGGQNHSSDVVIVQVLLNFNRTAPPAQLALDGSCGSGTIDAIREFQSGASPASTPDGRVDPNGATLTKLQTGLPPYNRETSLTASLLMGIMPAGAPSKITAFAPMLLSGMLERGIDTRLRQAHFLAQIGHESMSLVYTEELASGEAYEGRADLGNTQPGDGKRFKGRGLIQLTGRANYQAYGAAIGRDLTSDNADPTVVATDPKLAADVACWFWQTHHINAEADADDVVGVTRKINGGTNGLSDREAYLARARFFLR